MTTKNIMPQPVVILAAGIFPQHPYAKKALLDANTVVCCDGAAEKLLTLDVEPHYIVGDLDSVSEETKKRFSDRLHYVESQETNDLTKAVNFCVEQGVSRVTILGATGLREDHTLANISLLADYADMLEVLLITDYGVFTAIKKTTVFDSFPGQQVSIFSLTPQTRITLNGLKYPLHEAMLDSWWKGTLNESLGASFSLTFNEGRLIIFTAFCSFSEKENRECFSK